MLWTIAIIVGALLLSAALVSLLIFYTQFLRSPARQWSERVLCAAETAARQQDLERQRLQDIEQEHARAVAELQQRAFDTYLSTISVHELDHAPGIGPATVATLQKAGFRHLASLQGARIAVSGIGEKRLADIHAAVNQLTTKARQSFDAGHCPEAVALPRQVHELERRRQVERAGTEARLQAAADISRELEVRSIDARRVTFWNHLRVRFREQIPAAEMTQPLPDLSRALEVADAAARKALQDAPLAQPAPMPRATPARRRPERVRAPEAEVVPSRTIPPAREPAPVAAPMATIAAPPPDRSLDMLELTVQLLLAVARTDGRVAERERRLIEDHLRRRYEYSQALHNRAKALFAHYESAQIDIDRCLRDIGELFSMPHRTALVQVACEVAASTSGVNQRESSLLNRICTRLGISMPAGPAPTAMDEPAPAPPPKFAAVTNEEEWLATLEIAAGLQWSADLVRRQYHLLTARFEPAKVRTMGPEFAAMAEQKRAAVREAAEGLLRKCGLPLEEAPPATPPAELRHNPDLDALFGG
jgi:tellurite resistance protein